MKLYENIASALSKKGINLVVGNIYDMQEIWKSWYRGNVNDFHYYTLRVNGKEEKCERKTMNMPKKICEDITKLLWTEKTRIELSNKKATERLWEVLDNKENSFTVNFPIFIEKALAVGTGVLIEYKNEQDKTIIDYLDGTVAIPYKYTNSYISGLITISRFVEEIRKKKIYYTHITYHEYENGTYRRLNELYKSSIETELGKEESFTDKFPNVKELEEIPTSTPRFQIFKPNVANNFDMDSPMGISVLANSIDRFKAIDTKYDCFCNEFELGRKRILVDQSAMKGQMQVDGDGTRRFVQYFDANDKAYVGINGMEGQPVKEIDFSLRHAEHIDSINAELNWLSSNIGLGGNFYKFNGQSTKTATEVISENSDAFRTKEHYSIIVHDVIYDLVKVICEMEGIKANKISIIPDDSIIEDKNAEQIRAQQEVIAGLMSKISYLMNVKGMTEEKAKEELQKIQDEKMSNQEAFGFTANEDISEE